MNCAVSRVLVPGLGHRQVLVELGLVGLLQLGIAEDVGAIVEREHVAVVEEAPALALEGRQELVERVEVLEIGLVHVLGDVVVDRQDHAAVRERGDPGGLDVEDVVGAGARDVLGDRLGVLVRVRQFLDVEADAGQVLPERAREVPGLERLQAGLVGHVEGGTLVLLGGLDGAIGRVLRRAFGRRLDRGGLRLAERRARVRELDRGARRACCGRAAEERQTGPRERGRAAELDQPAQERPLRGAAPQQRLDLLGQARLELAPLALTAHGSPPRSPRAGTKGAHAPVHLVGAKLTTFRRGWQAAPRASRSNRTAPICGAIPRSLRVPR